MGSNALGALAALAASSLFSVGLVLQATATRGVDSRFSLHFSLIRELVTRPRWVVGSVVTLLGYPLHVVALLLAPLTVVQPALAAGLLVLLVIGSRTPGESVGRRDAAGVAAIVIGILAMTLGAPDRADVDTSTGPLIVGLVLLGAVTLVPYIVTRVHETASTSLATMAGVAAGTAYAFDGLTTKLVADHLADDEPVLALGWLVATGVVGALGFLGQATALQGRSATQVGPVIYVIPVLVPVLLAPFLTGEDWGSTPLGGGLLVASLVIVCVGTWVVSSSSPVRAVEREAPAAAGSG